MYLEALGGHARMASRHPVANGWKAHQYVAREGDAQSYFHYVLEGWACRYTLLPDGRRQITALFLPGDYCELQWVHSRTARQHIVALTNMRTMRMEARAVRTLAEERATVRSLLWADALHCSALQNEWILNLGRKNALEKLSHLFCELYYRLKRCNLTYGDQCAMPLTQLDLADITGLTPVHVNRTLQDMRTLGLVELRSRWLKLPDMARLQQIAIFDAGYLNHIGQQSEPGPSVLFDEPLPTAC